MFHISFCCSRVRIAFVMAVCASWLPASGSDDRSASVVKIVKSDGGYALLRNGTPYFIKGAVGAVYLDKLVAAGGNSIRAGGEDLDRARELGLTVLAGLRVGKQRLGFDYPDTQQVARQLEAARQTVLKYKDHPALLMWALGNELELRTTPDQRVPLWKAVNQMAEMVHQVDGKHPVITVLGNQYKTILPEVDEYCPALDAVGLNLYADMLTLPEDLARTRWARPFLITEFGPIGHWQVPKTPWKMPIEDTSTEKAGFYLKAYRNAVQDRPRCLGSYVFHWADHHEKTHTWYGMFLPDGSRTAAVDAMTYVWTGRWPANRCPRIGPARIKIAEMDGRASDSAGIFPAGARLRCTVDADDPEGDPLTIKWDLRVDVADNPNTGGDKEETSPPIEAAVLSMDGNGAVIQLPRKAAKYRIFVYVYDDKGSAATANVPIVGR